MLRFLPFVFLLLLSLCLDAQAPIQIQSTDGYTVNIELIASGVQVNTPCPDGYNYDVVFDYDITFTGDNIPQDGLWTLQGEITCGGSTLFLPLPNTGGQGTLTTNGNAYESDCSVAPTVGDLLCDGLELTVNGSGIDRQDIDISFVLPVELVSFTANPVGKMVRLDWATSAETDNDYFEVQRSSDAQFWATVDRVGGQGSTASIANYHYYDEGATSSTVYYRLRQVDFDGAFSFSPIIAVQRNTEVIGRAFPNPTNGVVSILAAGEVVLRDLTGRVLQRHVNLNGQTTTLDLSELPAGMYLLQTSSGTEKILRH